MSLLSCPTTLFNFKVTLANQLCSNVQNTTFKYKSYLVAVEESKGRAGLFTELAVARNEQNGRCFEALGKRSRVPLPAGLGYWWPDDLTYLCK